MCPKPSFRSIFLRTKAHWPTLASQSEALKLKLPFLLLDNIFYKTLHAHVNIITNFLFLPVAILLFIFPLLKPRTSKHPNQIMQTKGIRLWSKNYTLASTPSIGRFYQSQCSIFLFFFRQLCCYISDSFHLFTLFLTDSLEKCQTKSFENEYSTFCNFHLICQFYMFSASGEQFERTEFCLQQHCHWCCEKIDCHNLINFISMSYRPMFINGKNALKMMMTTQQSKFFGFYLLGFLSKMVNCRQ